MYKYLPGVGVIGSGSWNAWDAWNGWQAGRLAGWRKLTPLEVIGVSAAGLGLELGRTMIPGAHINMAFFLICIHDLDLEHARLWFFLPAVDVSSVSSLLETFPW